MPTAMNSPILAPSDAQMFAFPKSCKPLGILAARWNRYRRRTIPPVKSVVSSARHTSNTISPRPVSHASVSFVVMPGFAVALRNSVQFTRWAYVVSKSSRQGGCLTPVRLINPNQCLDRGSRSQCRYMDQWLVGPLTSPTLLSVSNRVPCSA